MPRYSLLAAGGLLLLAVGCASSTRPVSAGSANSAAAGAAASSSAAAGAAASNPAAAIVAGQRSAAATVAGQHSAGATVAGQHSAGSTAPAAPPSAARSSAPGLSSAAPRPHTVQIVLRPVTSHGTVAPGYTLSRHLDDSVSCIKPDPSPVGVDQNITECSPSAEYAVACWAGPAPHTVLCYRNPFAKQVDLLSTSGSEPAAPAPVQPSPYALVLSDGRRCLVRDGGAWGSLDGHPGWYGTYGCADGRYVLWGVGPSDGVDRNGSLWTVQLSAYSGHGPLRTVAVAAAYFVGTAG